MTDKGERDCLWGDENVSKLIMVIIVHICEYTKILYTLSGWIVVYELYLHKTVIFLKGKDKRFKKKNIPLISTNNYI